jgi:putative FmdB family regulatory protein
LPLYEYRCLACGRTIEALQRYSDPPLRKCESCGGKVEKLISRSAFHLKGGGWYAEGYGGDKKPAKSETKSEPKPASDSSTEKKKKTPPKAGSSSDG